LPYNQKVSLQPKENGEAGWESFQKDPIKTGALVKNGAGHPTIWITF